MLHYGRIDISKAIDLAKSNNSKECMIRYYCLFNLGFKFQDSVCNGYLVFAMSSINKRDIAVITIKNVHCRCIIHNH